MEIFYLPQGMTNKPWDLNKEKFQHQFEDMKTYMKKKEIEDSKNFTARRLRAVEKAREKEERRAEYDPEGFFRPGTASSAVILPSNSFHRVTSERAWAVQLFYMVEPFFRQKARDAVCANVLLPRELRCVFSADACKNAASTAVCCCADKHGHVLQASGHSAASSLQQELMKKDAWDRYTQDELRDDLLDFCRKDFEFESTEV